MNEATKTGNNFLMDCIMGRMFRLFDGNVANLESS